MLPSNNLEQGLEKSTHPTEIRQIGKILLFIALLGFFLRESLES